MSWNFKRSRRPQQANLKLKGQKLFNIDDGAGQLSSFGGLLPLAKLAEDSGLLKMAASLIPEWRKDDAVVFPVDLQLLKEYS